MTQLEFDPRHCSAVNLVPPVSKSDAVRALVLAHALDWPALADRVHAAPGPLPSDVQVAAAGLAALRAGESRLECHDGGAPFRFLLGQAAVREGQCTELWGLPRLGQRPHGALFEALERTLGPAGLCLHRGTPWPIEITGAGRAPKPVFWVRGGESSQFASSLLFAAAALARREQRGWQLVIDGPQTSPAYFELSLDWARRCGVPVTQVGSLISVDPALPATAVPELPFDWSSLGYLLAIAWKTGATVEGVDAGSLHPDRAVLGHLASVGLNVTGDQRVRVEGTAQCGLYASAAETPDLILTLAALACVLPAPSTFTEVRALVGKESDRLAAAVALAEAGGARTRLEDGTLTVTPTGRRPRRLQLAAGGDHRLAMSAATLAVLLDAPLSLGGPECVAKSFPAFWEQLGA